MSVLLKLLSYNGASYLTWEKLSCKSLSRNHWYSSKTSLNFNLIYFQTFLCASSNCSSSFFGIQFVHNTPFFEFPLPKHKHAAASVFFPTLAFFPCAVHPPNSTLESSWSSLNTVQFFNCQCQNSMQWAWLPYTTYLEVKQKCLFWASAQERNTSSCMAPQESRWKHLHLCNPCNNFCFASSSKFIELLFVYSMYTFCYYSHYGKMVPLLGLSIVFISSFKKEREE